MAAFAINLRTILARPKVQMGYKPDLKTRSARGHIEADFLKNMGATRGGVECRGPDKEVS